MLYIALILIILAISLAAYAYFQMQSERAERERKLEWLRSRELIVLAIQVPKNNEKSPLAAEQVFASLHGIYRAGALLQEELSFEIVASAGAVRFYAIVPSHLRDFLEGQIYAQYPEVEIRQVDDYVPGVHVGAEAIVGTELTPDKPDVYPIKQYQSFDVDPLAGITSVLANLKERQQVWIQMIIRPESEDWQQRGIDLVKAIRAGKPAQVSKPHPVFRAIFGLINALSSLVKFFTGSTTAAPKDDKKDAELPAPVQEALHGVEEKITKLGFATKLRLVSVAHDEATAKANLTATVSAYTQFNTNNLNNFKASAPLTNDEQFFGLYWSRLFLDAGHVFNITELASLFHFPSSQAETPNIVWAGAKKSEPPANLPLVEDWPSTELTVLGMTDFRQRTEKFGIKVADRLRHMYIIGKSGTGKSTLLENMILDDVRENRGVIVVDPHGELVEHVIDEIPDHRLDDTILVDPSDREFPIGINLLETVDDDLKGIVASGFVGIFQKIFGNSWGPRLEYILRNAVLALLDTPDQTMLGIPKMLVEKKYRSEIVKNIKDPVVKDFWENEFEQYDPKFRTEAVAPIQNKVGQFLSTPVIRNIVGQAKSTINIREVMDQEKILLLNLSKGKVGEDNSALLGAMLITKVQLAAMSRANIASSERKSSFLYVDEFQNFATESFATILSEARKYGLSLTMANQYIAQMEEVVREAVFGNVGSLISFRVGAGDAPFLAKEYAPVFDEQDMVNLDIHHIYLKLSIDGKSAQAFSGKTLPPIYNHTGHTEAIRERTRARYGVARDDVEDEIAKWNEDTKPKLVIHPGQERFVRSGAANAPVGSGSPNTNRPQSYLRHSEGLPSGNREESRLQTDASFVPEPRVTSSVPPVTAPEPQIADKPFIPGPAPMSAQPQSTNNMNPDAISESTTETELAPREKPLPKNLINGLHYREMAKRGGEKWYFAVPYYLPDGTAAGNFEVPDTKPLAKNVKPSPRVNEKPAQAGKPPVQNDALKRAIQEIQAKAKAEKPAAEPVAERPASASVSPQSAQTPADFQAVPENQPIEL